MASSSSPTTFKPLYHNHLHFSSSSRSKFSTSFPTFNFHSFSTTLPPIRQAFHRIFSHLPTDTCQELSINTSKLKNSDEKNSGLPTSTRKNPKFREASLVNSNIQGGNVEDRHKRSGLNHPRRRRKISSAFPSETSKKTKEAYVRVNEERKKESEEVKRTRRNSKKSKVDDPGIILRAGLDMCSKRGDFLSAIRLYYLARSEGIKMEQYHYAVLLYLCSSAATGFVQPAKSGSGVTNRSLNQMGGGSPKDIPQFVVQKSNSLNIKMKVSDIMHLLKDSDTKACSDAEEDLGANGFPPDAAYNSKSSSKENRIDFTNGFLRGSSCKSVAEMIQMMKSNHKRLNTKDAVREQVKGKVKVSDDVKIYALKKGFEIYEYMRSEKVPMNEATFTSVARMAMSLGDGDMAFDIVKQMKECGIQPRLRSYGPALSVFCNDSQDVEKAFMVEQHMLDNGVYPEGPELEALLRVSVEAGRSDKIYYLLHTLRTSVRQVSPSTADLIEMWFRSNIASRVGKRKWDDKLVKDAMENGGGGWHGQGWLGKGKWIVSRTCVSSDGHCKSCYEKLVTIDLDPIETEKFARSVSSIAAEREKDSSFQKFQKWLDYYGPFEAVVDAANIGLFNQRQFKPSKVNAVVNAIRQVLPSKKWPLIVLHNRRVVGQKMEEPFNKAIVDKWKKADALYATPTGSNDDWYWLYAAIKCRSLLVTNDEMRDHLFQLLGNDFFPKWKERHQVRFSFSETGLILHMPPPCSVVIQESEKGHWHIPIVSDSEAHGERTWLCVTRTDQDSSNIHEDTILPHEMEKQHKRAAEMKSRVELQSTSHYKGDGKKVPQETYKNLKNIVSASLSSDSHSILHKLMAAEEMGNCIIDFQI